MEKVNTKHLRFLSIAFLLVVCQFSLAYSGEQEQEISDPPKRVVSLVPTATEIMFEIGAKDAIAGVTYHDSGLEGALGKNVVGGFFKPSIEKIKALDPDMLILSSLHKTVAEAFKDTRCKVLWYDTNSIAKSYENILTLGRMFGKDASALALVQKNRSQIEHIKEKLARAVPGKRKRVIRLMGRDEIMTPGNDSFQNDLIRMAGGIPPDFGRKGGVIPVTKEEWTAFNPEVIYGCKGDEKAAEKHFHLSGWKDVDAIKNNQIFYFPCELTCRAAAHSGYFVSWLSSMIYMQAFADPKNNILPVKIIRSTPIALDLDYVKSAAINTTTLYDFKNKTLMVDFKRPQTIVSTLEGQRDNILTVGNHYSPPPTWGPGHYLGIDDIRSNILKANGKEKKSTSFLITGANMDNLSVKQKEFRQMRVTVLATAGVMSNAVRMSKDTGKFYEPGTINIIIMTNMRLSKRAMTRAIIAATEAKTAALGDMDIRSTYSPLKNEATGTGTDNVLVVQGEGTPIKNTGGHSKMGELIAKTVYEAVKDAALKQNKVSPDRHIFQRLKERNISLYGLTSGVNCDCMEQNSIPKSDFAQRVEHLMLQPSYASFMASAFALSDDYEKGLIKDLELYHEWCLVTASKIAGRPVEQIEELLGNEEIPLVLKTALNTIFTGVLEQLRHE